MDRNRNKIIDIVVSRNREKWVYVRMAQRLKKKGYKVQILCTDGYEGYGYYKLAKRHVVSKAETSLVGLLKDEAQVIIMILQQYGVFRCPQRIKLQ